MPFDLREPTRAANQRRAFALQRIVVALALVFLHARLELRDERAGDGGGGGRGAGGPITPARRTQKTEARAGLGATGSGASALTCPSMRRSLRRSLPAVCDVDGAAHETATSSSRRIECSAGMCKDHARISELTRLASCDTPATTPLSPTACPPLSMLDNTSLLCSRRCTSMAMAAMAASACMVLPSGVGGRN
eukprot:scaffold168866_cov25-Tisochrysis_lutea.AAC.2